MPTGGIAKKLEFLFARSSEQITQKAWPERKGEACTALSIYRHKTIENTLCKKDQTTITISRQLSPTVATPMN